MQRVIELEAEVADFERQAMRSLTPEQKQQILQLGKDFPRLWKAPTTSACDRKRMLRLLIRDIAVVKGAEPKLLHLQIRWPARLRPCRLLLSRVRPSRCTQRYVRLS